MRTPLQLALMVLVVACGSPERPTVRPPPPAPPPPVVEPIVIEEPTGPIVPEDATAPEGPTCFRSSECEGGLACRGPAGCASGWACGAPRDCGTERVAYCDCDWMTFYAQSGCPGRTYMHVGPCEEAGVEETSLGVPDGDEPITSEDRTCDTSADCPRWQVCFGIQGCGTEWRCERVRGCSRRTIAYCGCDGETFTASEECPGRAFMRRGACDEVIASTTPEPTTTTSTPVIATTTTPATTTVVAPPPGSCTSSRECRAGRVCTGPQGCGMVWTCERPAERCNPDTQVFCDCEGETFRASMTCPGQPYAHRGSCEMDHMLDLSGAALR
jgi:hypothetical protein